MATRNFLGVPPDHVLTSSSRNGSLREVPLVKPHLVHYFQTMVKDCLFVPALAGCALFLHPAMADTIQLKDKASVVGKVLAEKRDQVAVDIGYTVLTIPRNQIVKISRTDKPEAAVTATKTPTRSASSDPRETFNPAPTLQSPNAPRPTP